MFNAIPRHPHENDADRTIRDIHLTLIYFQVVWDGLRVVVRVEGVRTEAHSAWASTPVT